MYHADMKTEIRAESTQKTRGKWFDIIGAKRDHQPKVSFTAGSICHMISDDSSNLTDSSVQQNGVYYLTG